MKPLGRTDGARNPGQGSGYRDRWRAALVALPHRRRERMCAVRPLVDGQARRGLTILHILHIH
jgi:hypothetical protein